MSLQRICVDLERCEGHGRCYAVAPDLLGPMDDYGHAEFIGPDIDPTVVKQFERADRAVQSCPEEALSWSPSQEV